MTPNWDRGEWKHGRKPAVPGFNVDPYPYGVVSKESVQNGSRFPFGFLLSQPKGIEPQKDRP